MIENLSKEKYIKEFSKGSPCNKPFIFYFMSNMAEAICKTAFFLLKVNTMLQEHNLPLTFLKEHLPDLGVKIEKEIINGMKRLVKQAKNDQKRICPQKKAVLDEIKTQLKSIFLDDFSGLSYDSLMLNLENLVMLLKKSDRKFSGKAEAGTAKKRPLKDMRLKKETIKHQARHERCLDGEKSEKNDQNFLVVVRKVEKAESHQHCNRGALKDKLKSSMSLKEMEEARADQESKKSKKFKMMMKKIEKLTEYEEELTKVEKTEMTRMARRSGGSGSQNQPRKAKEADSATKERQSQGTQIKPRKGVVGGGNTSPLVPSDQKPSRSPNQIISAQGAQYSKEGVIEAPRSSMNHTNPDFRRKKKLERIIQNIDDLGKNSLKLGNLPLDETMNHLSAPPVSMIGKVSSSRDGGDDFDGSTIVFESPGKTERESLTGLELVAAGHGKQVGNDLEQYVTKEQLQHHLQGKKVKLAKAQIFYLSSFCYFLATLIVFLGLILIKLLNFLVNSQKQKKHKGENLLSTAFLKTRKRSFQQEQTTTALVEHHNLRQSSHQARSTPQKSQNPRIPQKWETSHVGDNSAKKRANRHTQSNAEASAKAAMLQFTPETNIQHNHSEQQKEAFQTFISEHQGIPIYIESSQRQSIHMAKRGRLRNDHFVPTGTSAAETSPDKIEASYSPPGRGELYPDHFSPRFAAGRGQKQHSGVAVRPPVMSQRTETGYGDTQSQLSTRRLSNLGSESDQGRIEKRLDSSYFKQLMMETVYLPCGKLLIMISNDKITSKNLDFLFILLF